MYDCVHWHCYIDYCVKLILVDKNLLGKLLLFHTENNCCWIPLGKHTCLRKAANRCEQFKLGIFWEHPLHDIWECGISLTLVILRVFPKHIFRRGVVATPPPDYQYWRSYNPKFTTIYFSLWGRKMKTHMRENDEKMLALLVWIQLKSVDFFPSNLKG